MNGSGREPAARAPSSLRVLLLVARLSLRRSRNRLGHLGRRRAAPDERAATGRKASGGGLLLGFMALVFAWQTVSTTALLVQRVSRLEEQRLRPDVVVLDEVTFTLLELASARQGGPGHALGAEGQALLERAAERQAGGSSGDDGVRARLIRETFAREGLAGFGRSAVPERQLWPSRGLWYAGADPVALLKPLAVVAFLLGLAQALQHIAGSDEDLARVGPTLEWLFSFPVRARALFLARAVAAPLTSPLVWVVLLPFYAVIFACAGLGALGVVLGAAAAVYVALWAGGARVLLETSLRRWLPTIWVSRIQALLLTFSVLPLAAGYAVAFSPVTSGLLSWASAQPSGALYAPPSLPLVLAAGGARAAAAAALGVAALGAWLAATAVIAERMVRDGVAVGGAEHRVSRGGPDGVVGRPAWGWRGVRLKEWRSLLRDRRARAQAFIAPVLLFAMQFLLNPSLAQAIASNPRHTATAAFAVAAFSLTTSAFTSLAAEGPALYWLYMAPVELERSLADKLWVRGSVSAAFGALVFVATWLQNPGSFLPSLPYAALALLGIGLYSVIALGIGTLGTDPLEPEPRRRVRPGGMYLFMLLAALFAYAIYTPSLWAKAVQLALSALLAYAIWQKLALRLPFLLDPTQAPPPAISVADGVIAALAFFVLSALFALPFGDSDAAPALVMLVTFVCAGSVVAGAALLVFRQRRVPQLMRALGLERPARPGGVAGGLALGVGAGGAAALLALGYLWLGRRVPGLAESLDEAQLALGELDRDARHWMLALAVLAAPVFEEFIFRGILYRGFRHGLRAPLSALASAVVFALVHPAATALPVCFMAWLAATAYERTGWLLTPVAAHMTYNAVVFGSALAS